MIYIVWSTNTNLVKIGYTGGEVKRRLQALQTSAPFPLKVVGTLEGSIYDERRLHIEFRGYRSSGEWFTLYPDEKWLGVFSRMIKTGYVNTNTVLDIIDFWETQNLKTEKNRKHFNQIRMTAGSYIASKAIESAHKKLIDVCKQYQDLTSEVFESYEKVGSDYMELVEFTTQSVSEQLGEYKESSLN